MKKGIGHADVPAALFNVQKALAVSAGEITSCVMPFGAPEKLLSHPKIRIAENIAGNLVGILSQSERFR